jgi:hypothetical protein
MYEPTKKIDSGTKVIQFNNEKYKINWKAEKLMKNDKRFVYITYNSMKNKKNKGYLHIILEKTSKDKMNIVKYSSPMKLPKNKIIKTKFNTDKYYWSKLRPQISKITKNSILNKGTLRYNEVRYFNRTGTSFINNKTIIKRYKMNWKVYYYSKTSSIEILKKYTDLNKNETTTVAVIFSGQDVRIDKYNKEKLRISLYPHIVGSGESVSSNHKYVKTNLSPKQYYLKVYKKKLETEGLT